ncbi:MAG: lysophospholipid acyltransferase family protein [Halioglobus sp.]|nr:lysophospholipid acyltransferase family protein [Halioglobus sp.]
MIYRLLSWLPLPVLYLLAWPAHLLLYYVAGYRKAVVRQNLTRAFPDRTVSEITVLAKKFYLQLAQVAFEILKTRRMSAADIKRRVTLVNPELLRSYSNDYSNSLILLAIHQGNWEWMLHGARLALDIPLDPVYKPLHSKPLDRLIFEIRSQFGSRPIPLASAPRDILRHRREFRGLVMVADQAPIASERSYWTTFLNGDAAFYEGSEAIARLTGFAVLFAQCRRLRRGHYEVEFHEVAQPPYTQSKVERPIIERYVQLAEAAIRAEPESWLWSNRRWKRKRPPVGAQPSPSAHATRNQSNPAA